MTEKQIETYLRNRAKAMGGKAYKFVSPGNDGVPDRLVCLPGGRIGFVELKVPGKKPTALQRQKGNELARLGFNVWVADSYAEIENLLGVLAT